MNIPRPQDDFFNYVNAQWIEENPIPAVESRWGSFDVLRVQVEKQLKEIFEKLEHMGDAELDENGRKVRDFYRTGMDTEKLNELKDAPLGELFQIVDSANDIGGLVKAIGLLHRRGIGIFWWIGAEQDLKNSDIVALYMGQGGLSLPDRDYYVNEDEKSQVIRKKYLDYADGILALSQATSAYAVTPKTFIDIETRLARASLTPVELRDIEKQYHKMTPAELAAISPRIDWAKYFEGLSVPMPDYMIVLQPEFIKTVDAMFGEMSLEDLKTYIRWHILDGAANFLGEEFNEKIFDFYGRTFRGATEIKPRWRRVLNVVNGMLDEAVAQLYVKEHFSENAKERVKLLVEHLTAAYKARIEKLSWMGPETKEKALEKLAAVTKKLGYPDKWKDLSTLTIDTNSYMQNFLRAYMFEFDRQMKKIGKPVDRSEWYMSPQTVNACYSSVMNEILFPAAILQAPFFDENVDDATNFGGIGTVIGHELTHGFDDQGALFDLRGNLQNWWTKEDKERFEKQTTHLGEQFDVFEPLPGLHLNGKLTMGENIADLGGLLIAYDGLTLALKDKKASGGVVDADEKPSYQRFFENYTVTERGHSREESLRVQIQTDPHSPSMYRVNGPLSNMTEFYEAFDVKPSDLLYREESDRVNIW